MSESINQTGEIPLSQTLESLLTDVEFVIEDTSIQDSTQATENRYSITEDSEDTREEVNDDSSIQESTQVTENKDTEDTSLPEHCFYVNTIMGKTGKNKGLVRKTFKLTVGVHTYTKNKDYNDKAYFNCTDCLRHKKHVSAIAHKIFGETADDDTYSLVHVPSNDQHVCSVSGTDSAIKIARMKMKHNVQDAPTKQIPRIYMKK